MPELFFYTLAAFALVMVGGVIEVLATLLGFIDPWDKR